MTIYEAHYLSCRYFTWQQNKLQADIRRATGKATQIDVIFGGCERYISVSAYAYITVKRGARAPGPRRGRIEGSRDDLRNTLATIADRHPAMVTLGLD